MIRNVPARQWFASRIPLLLCVVLLGPGVVPLSGHAWHPSPTPHEHPHHQTHTGLGTAPENEEPIGVYQALWLSLRSSALCGLVPISILYLVPKQPSEQALTWIQAGAVGGLLGDVFFHLFPHIAAQSADTTGSLVWYVVLLGILIFFFMDSVIHCAVSRDAHGEASVRRKHGPTSEGLSNQRNHTSSFPDKENTRRSIQASSCSRLWLTLCGDGLHNFTDGVALFTAFRLSYASGVATSLSIFAHEIPHEMGDFVLLFSQGLSRYQVIKTQIGTSLCSLMGCLVTAFVSNLSHTIEAWAPPFVAGTMLYLSLGSFLPQVLKRRGNIWDVLGSFVSCLLGVSIVALLAHMEETEFFVSL